MKQQLFHASGIPGRLSHRVFRWLMLPMVAVAPLLSSGCATTTPGEWWRNGFKVGPEHTQPPAPLADEWIEANDPRTQGQPRDESWWQAFQDPVLDGLITRAYANNPNLRAVGTRVLQARAQQAIAVGNMFPQSQSVTGMYPQGVLAGAPSHLDLTAFNLTWEADFWGKYRRQIESSNGALDASVENYDDALVTLLADVAINYVQYRVAQQQIKIARSNLESQTRLVSIVEEQNRTGTATAVDVDQLRTLMEQTRSTIPALRITQGQANDRLCILLGEPPRDLEPELGAGPEPGNLPMPSVPFSVAASIPAELLRRRPDIRSAERQVAAQSAQIGVAEAELYPSLSVGALLGYADLKLGSLLQPDGHVAVVQPQFTWKILNYGRLINNVHLQEARTFELVAAYQARVLQAAQEVQTALRGFMRSQEQAADLTRSVSAAVDAVKVGGQQFAELKADTNRLFILENAQLQTQNNLAVAQGNIALNLINVYRALGGGWELRLQAENVAAAPAPAGAEPVAEPLEPAPEH
ncbi:MAG TPA: efflux transporter outer membrane subunit [Planctomycetaceae bacterium]|nr:efflux transporter outer membrane subunit [Planctomycetaceae bacterium]